MDSKILCVSLLLAVFCLWSIEASSSLEEQSLKYEEDVNRGSEDTRAAIKENASKYASLTAQKLVNKARAIEAASRLYLQISKDRYYYAREYNRLAEEYRRRFREMEKLALADSSRIGEHQARQREWNSKAREADTIRKEEDQKAQQMFTKSLELRRDSIISLTEASIHQAQATADGMKADRATELSRDLRRKAEAVMNEAKNRYMRSKEDENKANSEKVKAHQQAEDSQRHLAASRAYQQEALRTRLSSRANIMKYIQNSLASERHQNLARENELKAEWSRKSATEFATISEQTANLEKIMLSEINLYQTKAKQDETKAYEYGESKKMMGSEMAEAGEMLYVAQSKDENLDEEGQKRLSIYPADDTIGALPSESKHPMANSDDGLD